jgi:hypothetical protein
VRDVPVMVGDQEVERRDVLITSQPSAELRYRSGTGTIVGDEAA